MQSDSTDQDSTNATTVVKSLDSDGFTLGSYDGTNGDGKTFVSWNWKESATAGFDIVSYTGNGSGPRTISHNLGVKPELIICKNREQDGTNWITYHKDIGAEKFLYINTGAAKMDDAAAWNDTEPTSSVFTVNADQMNNGDGDDIIAYVFASVEGFSKVGVWKGTANADGPFVYCGFRPAFLLQKRASDTGSWHLYDDHRNTYNPVNKSLYAENDGAEYTNTGTDPQIDFLGNGFKVRSSYSQFNGSNDDLLYIAFAKAPFKYANAH